VDHGGLLVGPCGPELVEGVLELVGLEGGPVGLAEHLHLVLEAGSHASFDDSSHGIGGGVGGLINRTQFLEPGRCVNMTQWAAGPTPRWLM